MAITGVQAGASGVFQVTWNGAMLPGQTTTWSVDDGANVTLTPSGDQVTAAVLASDTNPQFVLMATGTASDGTTVNATASVPVIPVPPTPATGGTIDQVS